jgi:hypothetical protein
MFEKKDEFQWEDYPKSLGLAVLDKIAEQWYEKKVEADKESNAWTDHKEDSYWNGKMDAMWELLKLLDLEEEDDY